MIASSNAVRIFQVPLIGATIFSLGLLMAYVAIQTYLVDVYEVYSASALAAAIFARGVIACVFPIIGFKLYVQLGYSWYVAFACTITICDFGNGALEGPRVSE